jgi:uncharacterized protein involved in propanediol utilization
MTQEQRLRAMEAVGAQPPSAVRAAGRTGGGACAPSQHVVAPAGHGTALAHHGELLQGAFSRFGGVRRALVSLPCPRFASTAVFRPWPAEELRANDGVGEKARRAAELALAHLGRAGGGELRLRSTIPLGWGLGSSTADVVAVLRAVADACGARPGAEVLARLAVAAETASDSTMFGPRCVLFAHREGEVVIELARPLPPLLVVGLCADEQGVPTLELAPPDYSPAEVRAFDVLAERLAAAVEDGDAGRLGEAATAGVKLNAPYLPAPLRAVVPRLLTLASETRALGCQVAHSGTVAGLLFDATAPDSTKQASQARTALTNEGVRACWTFATSDALFDGEQAPSPVPHPAP